MRTQFNKAFTILELVLVIVVVAILAALSIPRLDRDIAQEASDTILSDIRYTQQMAVNDFKQDFTDNKWQKGFWKISFEKCSDNGYFIMIGTDMDHEGDIDREEAALDPTNGKPFFWENTSDCEDGGDGTVSEHIFLTKKYGVKNVESSGSCAGKKFIAFDQLGRPQTTLSDDPTYVGYANSVCTFTFTMSDDSTISVNILPETGYAYIDGQEDS